MDPEVTGQPDAQDTAPEPAKSGGKADAITLSKKEYDALLNRTRELEESERYWAGQARSGKPTPVEDDDPEPEPEDEELPEDDSPEAFYEELSKQGIVALTKRGVLTKKEARELIQKEAERIARGVVKTERTKMESDAKLLGEFPELAKDGPLTKKTAEIFKEMVAEDPSLKKSTTALRAAARLAKKELGNTEEERLDRIARQAGDRGRRSGSEFQEDDDELSPMAKRILDRLNADGGTPITEEAYRKRAKAGVQMSARMGMQERTRRIGDWG